MKAQVGLTLFRIKQHSGFHTQFFPGRGKCGCVELVHVGVGAPTRVLWIFMKFWTYIFKDRKHQIQLNTLSLYVFC